VDLQFSATGFAQIMQGRLMVFRPSILQPVDPLPFTETKRSWPAVITARTWRDTVRVQLPPGFDVDEMPETASLTTPFGTFQSKATVEAGVLTFTRTLVLKSMVVPVAEYPALKAFSDQVGGADQAPIVLAKK
jgi:hypothetical protein